MRGGGRLVVEKVKLDHSNLLDNASVGKSIKFSNASERKFFPIDAEEYYMRNVLTIAGSDCSGVAKVSDAVLFEDDFEAFNSVEKSDSESLA